MIDAHDDSLVFVLQRFAQSHQRVQDLLAFLDAALPTEQHGPFAALIAEQEKADAEAALQAAASTAQAAGLDALAIVGAATATQATEEGTL
jgi:hypothetical protein